MKRVVYSIFSVIISISCIFSGFLKVNATDFETKSRDSGKDFTISISEPMTKEETARKFSKENGVSYKKAFVTLYPDEYKINRLIAKGMSSDTTRELAVGMHVKNGAYQPHISFYCYTSEWKKYWGIKSIYYVTLVRSYKGKSKQFSGDIKAWLRSPYQIEYVINGDFYDNSTQTKSVSTSGKFGINKLISFSGQVSMSISSSHYAYFYEHRTVAFQY